MAEPPKVGPPGGPTGGMESVTDWGNRYNKAVQTRHAEIFEKKKAELQKAATDLAPKERAAPDQQREQQQQKKPGELER
jgi:Skp family chaperone for outer membrane proteins